MGCYAAAWLAQLNAWVPVCQVGGGRLNPWPDHQSGYLKNNWQDSDDCDL